MDLHINVVGGLLLSEPASDLAVALAIASSFHEQPIAADLAAIGEIGCGLERRPHAVGPERHSVWQLPVELSVRSSHRQGSQMSCKPTR